MVEAFDAVVVGAGAVGAACAYYAGRAGLSVAVVDRASPAGGTTGAGRLVAEPSVGGRPAVVPTITGRAWLTGTAQFFLDPADPFPEGFLL